MKTWFETWLYSKIHLKLAHNLPEFRHVKANLLFAFAVSFQSTAKRYEISPNTVRGWFQRLIKRPRNRGITLKRHHGCTKGEYANCDGKGHIKSLFIRNNMYWWHHLGFQMLILQLKSFLRRSREIWVRILSIYQMIAPNSLKVFLGTASEKGYDSSSLK